MIVSATGQQSHALTSAGHDASEDGTGRGTPVIVNALDRQAGGPDNNSAQAGHLISFDAEHSNQGNPCAEAVLTRKLRRAISSPATGVRRLTPVECERLMSWPDDWTAIDGEDTPDSRRYAACGDGVVSNVAEWLARGILNESETA